MGKKVTTLIMGILFGLSLCGAFYLFFVLGLAFGLATGNNLLFFISYLFIPLGIVAIIGASLVFKSFKATRIMLLIPTLFYLFVSVYSFILGAFSILYLIIMIIIFALGLIPTILAFLIKKEEKHILANPGNVKADKETMKLENVENSDL